MWINLYYEKIRHNTYKKDKYIQLSRKKIKSEQDFYWHII